MQRSLITFTKAPRVLAVVASTLMVAGAAMAQDDVDLFPIECKDLFGNLYVLNDNVRANLEFLVDLYQTRGGNTEIAASFNTPATRQAAAEQLASIAQVLDSAYVAYKECEVEHGATPTMYPMSRTELAEALATVEGALLASPFDAEALLSTLSRLTGWDGAGHGCLLANMDRIHPLHHPRPSDCLLRRRSHRHHAARLDRRSGTGREGAWQSAAPVQPEPEGGGPG